MTPTLSVVIVSYNVRADLLHCLESIYASSQNVSFSVWVVDNASSDGSAAAVAEHFPQVHLVRNCDNVGFARANNQALRSIDSEFALLLNPDTIVGDHAFDETISFLRATPRAAAVSCKLVTADGSLDLACRRSFPTAFDGLCRAAGFSRLFPQSQRLARYNVTYLDENQTAEIDAINGAFMMVRRAAIEEVGLLDEDYFMYMEDLDWCYRFKAAGWRVFYHPTTTVVHLKGRSGRQSSSRMIHAFFESMELFVRKHYRRQQSWLTHTGTRLGIRMWMCATLCRNALRAEKRVTP